MNSIIYDAHLHVPKNSVGAIDTLVNDMNSASIERAVLIVNTEDELDIIKNNVDSLVKNRDRFHIVSGVNIKRKDPICIYRFFCDLGFDTDIKLHPKMYEYTINDYKNIIDTLSRIEYKCIVVDSLCFGENIKNHIGIELSIKLAKDLPQKNIIIAHSGFIKLLECQMYTRNLYNIFYDLSFTASYINHTSVRMDMINFLKHTSNRILFGSDYPDFDFNRALLSFDELCKEAQLSDEDMENVYFKNAMRLYWRE